MTTDHVLFKALLISLTIHMGVVCGGYWMNMPHQRARVRNVEITYRPANPQALDIRQSRIRPAQKLDLQNSLLVPSNDTMGVKLVNDGQDLKDFVMYERRPVRIRSLQVNHITVTPIRSEKMNNPIYTSYQDRVRESIKERVYANYSQLDDGNVYLTFIIASDGTLKDYQVIDRKTTASQNLRYVSTKSLQEARFPPFLKGMTLPEYTFNIEIEYQVRDQ